MIIMMDKEFTVLTECELAKVDGGKGSKGSSYVAELIEKRKYLYFSYFLAVMPII